MGTNLQLALRAKNDNNTHLHTHDETTSQRIDPDESF